VIDQLVELRRRYSELLQRDGHIAEKEYFSAEQNARLVLNAERYYRSMFMDATSRGTSAIGTCLKRYWSCAGTSMPDVRK